MKDLSVLIPARNEMFLAATIQDVLQNARADTEVIAVKVWAEWLKDVRVKDHDHRPTLYMFPNGQFCGDVDYNPFDLFHSLSRKTDENPWHKRILEGLHR